MTLKTTNALKVSLVRAATLAVLLFSNEAALAQGTAFTYQGRLVDNGTPANGNYDVQFKLFDMLTAGNQQASFTNSSVTVTNGSFTVQLDFGVCATCFDGSSRFLEIGVKPSGSPNAYTVLMPRQPITSAPYTIRSLSSAPADMAANATQLGGITSTGFIQNTISQQTGTFNVSGNGTLGGTLTAGTANVTGNVGVGTTGPLAKLQVVTTNDTVPGNIPAWDSRHFVIGGTASSGGIGMSYDQTNNVGYIEALSPSVAWRNLVLQSGGGNVGIGNTSPNFGLDVEKATGNTNAKFGSAFGLYAVANSPSLGFNAYYNGAWRFGKGSTNHFGGIIDLSPVDGGMHFSMTNVSGTADATVTVSERMRITQAGNVGIGATNPGAKLEVGGSALLFPTLGNGSLSIQNRSNTNVSQVIFNDDSGTYRGYMGYIGVIAGLGSRNDTMEFGSNGKDITFRPSETETMRLTPNNVQAGNASSGSNFVQSAPGGWRDSYRIFRDGNQVASIGTDLSGSRLQFFTGSTTSNATASMTIDSNGQVGIRSSPAPLCPTCADVSVGTFSFAPGSAGGNFPVCTNSASLLILCASSRRYKDDILSYAPGLETIRRLRPVTFNWKQGGQKDLGLVAEEVTGVNPLLTYRNNKGEIEGVKYDRVTVVLVNAVKEQQAQIESQQKEIDALKKIVDRIRARASRRRR